MPVNTTINKMPPYSCNGSQTIFPFTFPIFSESNIEVTLRDADGNETTLILGNNYTVSKSGASWNNGGNVVTVTTYPSGNTITIRRVLAVTQETDYIENDSLPSELHENDHDKITMIAQQLDEKINRAIRFPVSDPSSISPQLPTSVQRASKYLACDANGQIIAVVGAQGTYPVTPAAATLLDDATISDILTTLGFSEFMKTLRDDADAAAARNTLSAVGLIDQFKPLFYSNWFSRTAAANNLWRSICWSPALKLFCAVAASGSGNRVMTSPDGINWTSRTSAADVDWRSVCWSPSLGLFCAVADAGATYRVMYSSDGSTWNLPFNNPPLQTWTSICWSPSLGLFCAVASSGIGNRVMTSPDGETWASQTSAGDKSWTSVCWSPELNLFCAVSQSPGDLVMTSPNGTAWTARTPAANKNWQSVCWSPELGLFCAVASDNNNQTIMTSPNGINWTLRTAPVNFLGQSVCWSPELGIFCAVSGSVILTSPDGINWTFRAAAEASGWQSICWAQTLGVFCAVANTGTYKVMNSLRWS